jgi:hypothetical protein
LGGKKNEGKYHRKQALRDIRQLGKKLGVTQNIGLIKKIKRRRRRGKRTKLNKEQNN